MLSLLAASAAVADPPHPAALLTAPIAVARPASPAGAKPPAPPALAVGGGEVAPTSRSLIVAEGTLRSSRFSEASLRAAGGLISRTTFSVARTSIALQGSSDASAPRLALGPSGGAAVLVKLPETTAGLGGGDAKREPAYALATVAGTRVRVWAVYASVPSDDVLSRRMIAAFAKLGAPLMTFDPTFVAGPGAGADRYMLK